MSAFKIGQKVDGITTEGDVKLEVIGFHDGSPIVKVLETFLRGDVEHQEGEVFVAAPLNLTESDPNEGWKDWEQDSKAFIERRDGSENLTVTFYKGAGDAKPVIQVDGDGDFRINVNDCPVYDRSTDSESRMNIAALAHYKQLAGLADHEYHFNLEELREELVQHGFTLPPLD